MDDNSEPLSGKLVYRRIEQVRERPVNGCQTITWHLVDEAGQRHRAAQGEATTHNPFRYSAYSPFVLTRPMPNCTNQQQVLEWLKSFTGPGAAFVITDMENPGTKNNVILPLPSNGTQHVDKSAVIHQQSPPAPVITAPAGPQSTHQVAVIASGTGTAETHPPTATTATPTTTKQNPPSSQTAPGHQQPLTRADRTPPVRAATEVAHTASPTPSHPLSVQDQRKRLRSDRHTLPPPKNHASPKKSAPPVTTAAGKAAQMLGAKRSFENAHGPAAEMLYNNRPAVDSRAGSGSGSGGGCRTKAGRLAAKAAVEAAAAAASAGGDASANAVAPVQASPAQPESVGQGVEAVRSADQASEKLRRSEDALNSGVKVEGAVGSGKEGGSDRNGVQQTAEQRRTTRNRKQMYVDLCGMDETSEDLHDVTGEESSSDEEHGEVLVRTHAATLLDRQKTNALIAALEGSGPPVLEPAPSKPSQPTAINSFPNEDPPAFLEAPAPAGAAAEPAAPHTSDSGAPALTRKRKIAAISQNPSVSATLRSCSQKRQNAITRNRGDAADAAAIHAAAQQLLQPSEVEPQKNVERGGMHAASTAINASGTDNANGAVQMHVADAVASDAVLQQEAVQNEHAAQGIVVAGENQSVAGDQAVVSEFFTVVNGVAVPRDESLTLKRCYMCKGIDVTDSFLTTNRGQTTVGRYCAPCKRLKWRAQRKSFSLGYLQELIANDLLIARHPEILKKQLLPVTQHLSPHANILLKEEIRKQEAAQHVLQTSQRRSVAGVSLGELSMGPNVPMCALPAAGLCASVSARAQHAHQEADAVLRRLQRGQSQTPQPVDGTVSAQPHRELRSSGAHDLAGQIRDRPVDRHLRSSTVPAVTTDQQKNPQPNSDVPDIAVAVAAAPATNDRAVDLTTYSQLRDQRHKPQRVPAQLAAVSDQQRSQPQLQVVVTAGGGVVQPESGSHQQQHADQDMKTVVPVTAVVAALTQAMDRGTLNLTSKQLAQCDATASPTAAGPVPSATEQPRQFISASAIIEQLVSIASQPEGHVRGAVATDAHHAEQYRRAASGATPTQAGEYATAHKGYSSTNISNTPQDLEKNAHSHVVPTTKHGARDTAEHYTAHARTEPQPSGAPEAATATAGRQTLLRSSNSDNLLNTHNNPDIALPRGRLHAPEDTRNGSQQAVHEVQRADSVKGRVQETAPKKGDQVTGLETLRECVICGVIQRQSEMSQRHKHTSPSRCHPCERLIRCCVAAGYSLEWARERLKDDTMHTYAHLFEKIAPGKPVTQHLTRPRSHASAAPAPNMVTGAARTQCGTKPADADDAENTNYGSNERYEEDVAREEYSPPKTRRAVRAADTTPREGTEPSAAGAVPCKEPQTPQTRDEGGEGADDNDQPDVTGGVVGASGHRTPKSTHASRAAAAAAAAREGHISQSPDSHATTTGLGILAAAAAAEERLHNERDLITARLQDTNQGWTAQGERVGSAANDAHAQASRAVVAAQGLRDAMETHRCKEGGVLITAREGGDPADEFTKVVRQTAATFADAAQSLTASIQAATAAETALQESATTLFSLLLLRQNQNQQWR